MNIYNQYLKNIKNFNNIKFDKIIQKCYKLVTDML